MPHHALPPRSRCVLVAAVLLCGCASPADPDGEIRVSLGVEPATVAAGDTVRFVAEAFNPTDRRIAIAGACGPALEVEVTAPDGTRRYLAAELGQGVGGRIPCTLGEEHFADPGETETVRLAWRVPRLPGTYRAAAGLRAAERRLDNRSPSATFTVR